MADLLPAPGPMLDGMVRGADPLPVIIYVSLYVSSSGSEYITLLLSDVVMVPHRGLVYVMVPRLLEILSIRIDSPSVCKGMGVCVKEASEYPL